jgi:hypothetical protein
MSEYQERQYVDVPWWIPLALVIGVLVALLWTYASRPKKEQPKSEPLQSTTQVITPNESPSQEPPKNTSQISLRFESEQTEGWQLLVQESVNEYQKCDGLNFDKMKVNHDDFTTPLHGVNVIISFAMVSQEHGQKIAEYLNRYTFERESVRLQSFNVILCTGEDEYSRWGVGLRDPKEDEKEEVAE